MDLGREAFCSSIVEVFVYVVLLNVCGIACEYEEVPASGKTWEGHAM